MALAKAQIGVTAGLRSLQVQQTTIGLPYTVFQVRFRKPRWLVPQRAPSKQGIYFHKPKPTEHDMVKTALAYKSYNAMLKSIAAAFQEEILLKEEKGKQEYSLFDEEAHHLKCMAYNDAYSAKLRAEREKRMPEILENQELEIKQKEERCEEELKLKLKIYEEEVMEVLKDYENWVNVENLEEKIEEAMNNITNYNFSVFRDGRIFSRTLIP